MEADKPMADKPIDAEYATETADDAAEPREQSAAEDKKKKSHKVAIGVIFAIVLIFVLAFTAFGVCANVGRAELMGDNGSSLSYKTMRHDGKTYAFNEDMVSVAIIGTDRIYGYQEGDTNACADAVMVLAYDTSSGKITLINVPRNLIVNYRIEFEDANPASMRSFLATAFSGGKDDAAGSRAVCDAVSRLFGDIPITEYVTMLESAIDPLTAAMGGVTVTAVDSVPQAGVEPGKTYTLTGRNALLYVQYRNIRIMSSPADRMRRQHDFAQAFVKQSVEAVKKDPTILGDFYSILTDPDYMTTNLDVPELAFLVSSVMQKGVSDLNLVTVPYTEDYDPQSQLVGYYAKPNELMDLILDVYYEPVEEQ